MGAPQTALWPIAFEEYRDWLVRALSSLNAGKPYAEQVKPFNFLLSAHIQELGLPADADPDRFHLIAPYESKPSKWLSQQWIEQYSQRRYRVSTSQTPGRSIIALKTYGDVLEAYECHPELKCAGSNGEASHRRTIGLLVRRHVRIDEIRFIGKESNRLEDVQAQGDFDPDTVYTEYADAWHDEWTMKILPMLKTMPMPELQRLSGLSRAALQAIRAGRRPHRTNDRILKQIARDFDCLRRE